MTSGLTIALDARQIGRREGGNETYIVELLRSFPRLEHPYQFHVIVRSFEAARRKLAEVAKAYSLQLLPSHAWTRILYGLPRQLSDFGADLYQAQYRLPCWPIRCRKVLVIRDLAHEHYPQFYRRRESLKARLLVRWSALRADHIITVSEFCKEDIAKTYGIDPAKITAIYEAAGESFRPIDRQVAAQVAREKYGLSFPYILYVGNIQPRKNLAALAKAYASIRTKKKLPHKLVIVGKKAWIYSDVFQTIRDLDLTDDVVFTEYVPEEDLPYLYNAAAMFAYPSIFEGFALPVVEAMACGVPVIASNTSSLPEIAGGAAVLVNPFDHTSIADAILEVAEKPALRERLVEVGLRRAQCLSWEETARKTLAVYEGLR